MPVRENVVLISDYVCSANTSHTSFFLCLAGKSTLMGQVLVSTGQVTKREAAKQGNLAFLLDENESERERGVTMEIGTKTLRVPNHDIVILDAPGHSDFIPV